MAAINLFPSDVDFSPSEKQLRDILDFFEIIEIAIVSGESGALPEVVETYKTVTILETPEDVFFESNVPVERAICLWKSGEAISTSYILGIGESQRLKSWSDALNEIDESIAGDFCPWDTSITIGPWEIVDNNDLETVVARGKFKISIINGLAIGGSTYQPFVIYKKQRKSNWDCLNLWGRIFNGILGKDQLDAWLKNSFALIILNFWRFRRTGKTSI